MSGIAFQLGWWDRMQAGRLQREKDRIEWMTVTYLTDCPCVIRANCNNFDQFTCSIRSVKVYSAKRWQIGQHEKCVQCPRIIVSVIRNGAQLTDLTKLTDRMLLFRSFHSGQGCCFRAELLRSAFELVNGKFRWKEIAFQPWKIFVIKPTQLNHWRKSRKKAVI